MQIIRKRDYKLRNGETQFRIKNETITITASNHDDYPQVFKCAMAGLTSRRKDYNNISDTEKKDKKIRKIFYAELASACVRQINQKRKQDDNKNIPPFPVWD